MMDHAKRVAAVEREIGKVKRRTRADMAHLEMSLRLLRKTADRLAAENSALRAERDTLLAKHRAALQELMTEKARAVRQRIHENVDLLVAAAKEDFEAQQPELSPQDQLHRLVMDRGWITSGEAARCCGVHEIRIGEWARELEAGGHISIRDQQGTLVLRRKA